MTSRRPPNPLPDLIIAILFGASLVFLASRLEDSLKKEAEVPKTSAKMETLPKFETKPEAAPKPQAEPQIAVCGAAQPPPTKTHPAQTEKRQPKPAEKRSPPVAIFNPDNNKVQIAVDGLGPQNRLRVVGFAPLNSKRFEVNFFSDKNIAFHFNPRFDENKVVINHAIGEQFFTRMEEHFTMTFVKNRVVTIEFVANNGVIRIFLNGRSLASFKERESSKNIRMIDVRGDFNIHSVHLTN